MANQPKLMCTVVDGSNKRKSMVGVSQTQLYQKMARGLKFRNKKVEGMYFTAKNTYADQLCTVTVQLHYLQVSHAAAQMQCTNPVFML